MTQVMSAASHAFPSASPSMDIPLRSTLLTPSARQVNLSLSNASTAAYRRNGHLNLDTFSPVNQNGSFAFDRVLKCGFVQKRTRKTKAWRSVYLVLRPNLLSIYKNEKEDKLRKQINPSDLTAVAYLKDPKREHVFGLFSPSRNFHLEAPSEKDAREWVELIRQEARIEEEEEEMYMASPGGRRGTYHGFERPESPLHHPVIPRDERLTSSSPEPGDHPVQPATTRDGVRIPSLPRKVSHTVDYSGTEHTSYSDFSDGADASGVLSSSWSIQNSLPTDTTHMQSAAVARPDRPEIARNASQTSGINLAQDDERVIWHGYLYCLKSKRGVRQWKLLWAVLRPKHLAFYKNEDEYAAQLLIPMSTIIDAVEIDPISKSKAHCMQIIANSEEDESEIDDEAPQGPNGHSHGHRNGHSHSHRFCAPTEDALAKWLGALKSQLAAQRKNKAKQKVAASSLMSRLR
ncbi:MAG: hypothetical protein M1838_005943 [Thelocarpon superellum]|nr:MAG: hypothetical protein M1838_005943 [Thelocarpon superellum]